MNKQCLSIAVAATLAAGASAVFAADSTDRTTMPDFCSNRDVNCVLPDGAPPRVVGTPSTPTRPVTPTQPTQPSAGFTVRGTTGGTAAIIPPTGAGGVAIVITQPGTSTPGGTASGAITGGTTGSSPNVPAVPSLGGQVPSATGSVPSLSGGVPTATTGGTVSGSTSSGSTGATSTGATSSGSTGGSAGSATGGTGFSSSGGPGAGGGMSGGAR